MSDELKYISDLNHPSSPSSTPSYRYPKSARLLKRREFIHSAHKSQRYVGRWVIVDMRLSRAITSRLGITVTRKYGRAHERNRFKRLVREAFRLSFQNFPLNLDLVVKPRSQSKTANMNEILSELYAAVKTAYETSPAQPRLN